jgi:hypothetical protein
MMKQMVYVVKENEEITGVWDEFEDAQNNVSPIGTITPVVVNHYREARYDCMDAEEVVLAMENELQSLASPISPIGDEDEYEDEEVEIEEEEDFSDDDDDDAEYVDYCEDEDEDDDETPDIMELLFLGYQYAKEKYNCSDDEAIALATAGLIQACEEAKG